MDMGLFYSRKPRRFHHEYMFIDTRKERLAAIKKKAEMELKADGRLDTVSRLERGVFLNATRYVSHRKEKSLSAGHLFISVIAVMLVFLLVLIWKTVLSL